MTVIDHAPFPPTPTTTELLRAAAAGHERAWRLLVDRFEPVVAGTIMGFRLQPADARDAAQGTWLRALEHHREIREPEALAGWLRTTARRECLRIIREGRRVEPEDPAGPDLPDRSVDVEQSVVDADTVRRLWCLMDLLPARSATLLRPLFRPTPPGYAELSRGTGIPMGSIGPTRARALVELRRMFDAGTVPAMSRPALRV